MARILIVLSLLLAAVQLSFSQPAFTANGTSVVIGSSACNDSQNVAISGGGTAIPFTVAINYTVGDPHGNWLYANVAGVGSTSSAAAFSANTGTNGVTLNIGLNSSIGGASDIAQVILTPTNSPASTPIAITVSYSQNTSCGSNTGSITNNYSTVTPGNAALAANQNGTQSETLSIRNLVSSSLTFGISVQPASQWLSARADATTIAPHGTVTIALTADGSKVSSAGSYFGTVTITPANGFGVAITIPVIFVVSAGTTTGGTSTGTLTLNGATSNIYATTFSQMGGSAPGSQCIPLQDSSANANSYTYAVSTASGGNWLLANFNLSGTTTGLIGPSNNACVSLSLANVAATLGSGVYSGTVALTSDSGSTAAISVILYVSGGNAPGVTASPGSIFSFSNEAVGSTALQQQVFSFTEANGYQLGTASQVNTNGCPTSTSWFAMTTPTVSGNTESFTGTANPTGLQAGIYCTLITLPSTGTAGLSSGTSDILIVLPVGQGTAGTGGSTGGTITSLVEPTALVFQQQAGSSFLTSGREAQSISITGQQGTQWSAAINYHNGEANWLNFDSPIPASGTFGSGPASLTLDLFSGISSLSPINVPYAATVDITTPSGTSSVGVSLLVTPAFNPVLLGLPALATFHTTTTAPTGSQVVQVVGSDNTNSNTIPIIAAGAPTASWVTTTTSNNSLTINVNSTGLSTGVYSGTVPITGPNYVVALSYPVVLVVNGGGGGAGPLTLSASSFTFANVISQVSQTLNVAAASSTSVNASFAETSCTAFNWLEISPGGTFTAGPTNTPMTITVNASGLVSSTTCTGLISLVTAGATQVLSVSMTARVAGSFPQLSLKLAADAPIAGAVIGYSAIVSNTATDGTGTATAVALTDPLPAAAGINWTIVPTYAGPGSCAITGSAGSQVLGCSLGDMAAAATASVHVSSVTAPANCGPYSDSATLTAGNNVTLQWGAIATVPCGQLSITNTPAVTFHQAQNGVTYTINVGNAASVGTATGTVTVTQVLPDGIYLVSMAGTGWTCSGSTCTRNDPLMPGTTYPSITVTVNVAATASSPLNDQVTVSGGGSPAASASALTTIIPFTCDINSDGVTTVADVQVEIDEALGVLAAVSDLNHDGAVNVADVQKLTNAALGLGCLY